MDIFWFLNDIGCNLRLGVGSWIIDCDVLSGRVFFSWFLSSAVC